MGNIVNNRGVPLAAQRSDDWVLEETPVKIAVPPDMPPDAAPDLGAIELCETWTFPRPGPRWAKRNEIPNRPAIPASLPRKWVGLQ